MYVCLFDIDGTLIDAAGAGESAMLQTLREDYAFDEITGSIPSAGRTDAAITTDLFTQHGLDSDQLESFPQAYLRRLRETLPAKNGRVLPGARELVERLSRIDHLSIALLTGNYEAAAWAKLTHFGLAEQFSFGAFGDEHCNRDDVARVAVDQVRQRIGAVRSENIWVIGDTPADIRCARAVGARVAAVATGIFSAEELRPHEPDILMSTLEDAEDFLAAVGAAD